MGHSTTTRNKVIVLGIDGASFNLLENWIKENELPNFKIIYDNGCSCGLKSTIPPWTAPAWVSFATGRNPGKHGVFDFFKLKNYNQVLISAKDIKSKTIWEILTDASKKVIVINAPVTYPSTKVNGVLISGMLTPSLDSEFTYPPELREELLKRNYKIGVELGVGGRSNLVRSFSFSKNKNQLNKLIHIVNEVAEKRAETAFWLMKKYDWDFIFLMFESIDRLQHYFWKDETFDVILKHYKKLDEILGKFLQIRDEFTTIIILSDHGFGAVKKKIYINNLLRALNLLTPSRNNSLVPRLLESGRNISLFLSKIRFPIEKILTHPRSFKVFSKLYIPNIDFTKSRAFLINSTSQAIYLNVKGRESFGLVTNKDYNKIRDLIIIKINNLTDPENGENVLEAYKREDIYKGFFVDSAPDIILKLQKGYSTDPTIRPLNEQLRKGSYMEKVKMGEKNADHVTEGIFMALGPKIKKKRLQKAFRIYDILPTVLYILNLPTPDDLDGKIMNIFK